MRRLGLTLDQTTQEYVESQRQRLGSLTHSQLVRDLLREHQRISAECARLTHQQEVLMEQVKVLQQQRRQRSRKRK